VLWDGSSFVQAKAEEASHEMDFGVARDGMVVRVDLVPGHFGRADAEEEAVDEGGVDGEPDKGERKVVGLEPVCTCLLSSRVGNRRRGGIWAVAILRDRIGSVHFVWEVDVRRAMIGAIDDAINASDDEERLHVCGPAVKVGGVQLELVVQRAHGVVDGRRRERGRHDEKAEMCSGGVARRSVGS
jgi:hypothetical protein